ncbi:glutamine synthetase family protein [Novosphingobium acidiphilum]|uniref:glutamine synthetase family protein n=1 Tax=Novosphingobium acidiphilum TaxID=505248 RepID=UPI0004039AAB|nr:glutamine synthetase family protein [Novosphingobium acidiphilum]
MSHEQQASLTAFLAAHPEIDGVEAFVFDIAGAAKGKWLARDKALALDAKGLPIPLSVFAQDAWGCDVMEAGLAFGTGDPDGTGYPVAGRFAAIPWLDGRVAQAFLTMRNNAGDAAEADPRAALAAIVARYAARGLTPVVAVELEFYLYRLIDGVPVPPDGAGAASWRRNDTLSTSALAAHQPLIDAILQAARAIGIAADGVISEAGPGQFELNILHRADALAMADDAMLMRRIVRGLAQKHGFGATFMAKPYGDASGSGMHIHASVNDACGTNVMADPATGAPAPLLFHAVAGLVAAMPDTMLAFAPNANSFRRFRPDAHAPVSAGWGHDDRSAAIRVIDGAKLGVGGQATRIEHRISGADANAYLAMGAMLGAMLQGIEAGQMPPPPQSPLDPGTGVRLPVEWGAAIDRFAGSDTVAQIFGQRLRAIVVACKRQDRAAFIAHIDRFEYDTYLTLL